MGSISAVSAVHPVTPIRQVGHEERPMNQEDIFCPRFAGLKSWEQISQWYDPASCQKCCSEAKRGKCAREKRKNYG